MLALRPGAPVGRASARKPCSKPFGIDGDEPADWVRAGRALERVLLLATAEGAAASFLNQALEVPGLRTEVRRLLGDFGEPQLLLRLGYAPQAGPALRRPLAEVLIP